METVRSQSEWLGPLVQNDDDDDDEGDDIFVAMIVIIMIVMGVILFLFGITYLLTASVV
jgi:heme/copper-type cytochrome/quinol oxidase subunit 2